MVPPTYLPTASFRPPAYPLLGSPTSVYYGMVPTLPAVGQMSPTGGGVAGGSGTTGYPAASGAVGGIHGVNPAGVLVQVPPSLAMAAAAGGLGVHPPPSADSTTTVGGSAHHQPSILYMQPVGVHQPHPPSQVTLSGSPVQQQEFSQPSSPVGFKAPPTLAAMAGEGGGGIGVAGNEGHQQQPGHLTELVTMTPIMAASASPSSSLNLSHGVHHHHHIQPHPLILAQQLQAAGSAHHSAPSVSGASGSGSVLFEHVQQQQSAQVVRPGGFQEGHGVTHPPHGAPHGQPLLAHMHHPGAGLVAATSGGEGVSTGSLGTTAGQYSTLWYKVQLCYVHVHALM